MQSAAFILWRHRQTSYGARAHEGNSGGELARFLSALRRSQCHVEASPQIHGGQTTPSKLRLPSLRLAQINIQSGLPTHRCKQRRRNPEDLDLAPDGSGAPTGRSGRAAVYNALLDAVTKIREFPDHRRVTDDVVSDTGPIFYSHGEPEAGSELLDRR